MIGIYKITSPNNQVYIGQSSDVEKRIQNHKECVSSNKHLSLSINEYGIENHTFEILEECALNDLIDRENFYLSYYKKKTILFNYSIYLLIREHERLVVDEPDFLINELKKLRAEKEVRKEAVFSRKVNLNIKINKIMKDELGEIRCKEIAEEAVNKHYKKHFKS